MPRGRPGRQSTRVRPRAARSSPPGVEQSAVSNHRPRLACNRECVRLRLPLLPLRCGPVPSAAETGTRSSVPGPYEEGDCGVKVLGAFPGPSWRVGTGGRSGFEIIQGGAAAGATAGDGFTPRALCSGPAERESEDLPSSETGPGRRANRRPGKKAPPRGRPPPTGYTCLPKPTSVHRKVLRLRFIDRTPILGYTSGYTLGYTIPEQEDLAGGNHGKADRDRVRTSRAGCAALS